MPRRHPLSLIPLILITAGGCGSASDLEGGPCDPVGRWEVSYTLAEGPDAHIAAQPGIDEIEISKDDTGQWTATFNDASPDTFSVSDDGCNIHIERNLSWTSGNEPWSDERNLDLTISGDRGTGTLLYGCYWNCGGMHGTLTYAAKAARAGAKP